MVTPGDIAEILHTFAGDLRQVGPLASFLGFEPVHAPADLLASRTSPLRQFFVARPDRFGVDELYRVGEATPHPGRVGLYVAVLSNEGWGYRSVDRDRSRRRVARALVERAPQGNARSMFMIVPPQERRRAAGP